MSQPVTDRRTRPRKQPRQARAQATVDAIVEAAARILEGQGYSGFTTNAVADRAGVSIGTLYQYFPDKDALLGSLIARETSLLMRDVELACALATGCQALDALIRAAVRHQVRRPSLARLLDREEGRMPTDPETQLVRSDFISNLREVLTRQDLPRVSDVSTAADDVAAIVKGMLDSAGERMDVEEEALVERVRCGVLGYLSFSIGEISGAGEATAKYRRWRTTPA